MPVTTNAVDVRTRARSWRSLARSYRTFPDDTPPMVAGKPQTGDECGLVAAMRRQVLKHARSPYAEAVVPRLTLTALDRPARGLSTVLSPVVCLILQGSKRVTIGDTVLEYGAGDCLLASLDVPVTGSVLVASPDRPYVAAGLMLDRAMLADLVGSEPRPFLQAIFDYEAPQMHSGRIALLGDAAFVVRPHTAMGVSKAAGDAMALRDALSHADNVEQALSSYNLDRHAIGREIAAYGQRLGRSFAAVDVLRA